MYYGFFDPHSSHPVGPSLDQETERHVQPVWLADTASRPPGRADHRQHDGPSREDHDQQSGEQTGESIIFLTD